jgi:2,3-bisphosphoglycerate-dependent phosphoglycerate mutase
MTTLYLVRHAHADWNSDDERSLSERGRAGADALADLLAASPIGAIYSSPARRAVETIKPLARCLGLEPVVVPDLRERELVVAPGVAFATAVQAAWVAPATEGKGSEANDAAQARGLAAIRKIIDEQAGRHTVVATHGNLLALILNGFNAAFGFEFWRRLTFPDVYEARFENSALVNVRRIWDEVRSQRFEASHRDSV